MEEIELRDALRQHVVNSEPPMSFTAADMVSKGRRQQRWRFGLQVGSASAATALALVGTIALTPLGGSVNPWLSDNECSLPIARNWKPSPSSYPTSYPDPSVGPTGVPSPYPTGTAQPSYEPSIGPSYEPSVGPSYEPSGGPTNEPSVGPTDPPVIPSPTSTGGVHPEPTGNGRTHEMQCHLAREMKALFPNATFAPYGEAAPFAVDPASGYVACGIVVAKAQTIQITFLVDKRWEHVPIGPEYGWSYREEGGKVIRHLDRSDNLLMVEVHTAKSTIFMTATGTLVTADQLAKIALAPEMDMFS